MQPTSPRVLTAADLAAIRAIVREELRPRAKSTDSDRAALAALLPALAGRFGQAEFTTAEVWRDAALTRVRGPSPRALGKLLARAEGCEAAGLTVERIGAEHGVALWRVGWFETP